MKKKICIIVPHKGIGDIIFHNSFIRSVCEHHKKKIFLFVNKSTKSDLIYNKNNFVEKIIYVDFKRPKKLFYLFKIIKITKIISRFEIDKIYYTGSSKWLKLSLLLVCLLKDLELRYIKVKKKYIISHLRDLMDKFNIRDLHNYDPSIRVNLKKKFINKIVSLKKPWVFLSVDTSEDQIKIPKKLLIRIINKLKKKYSYIYINTSQKNNYKTKFINDKSVIETSKFSILEIFFLIKNSKLFIGNESGPAVLASLYCNKSIIFTSKEVKDETSMLPKIKKRKYLNIDQILKYNNKILNLI